MTGQPSQVDIEVGSGGRLNIWFGLAIQFISLIFKDNSGNPISPASISVQEATCTLSNKGEVLSLKLVSSEEDRSFCVEPFQFEKGWSLKGEGKDCLSICVSLVCRGIEFELKASIDCTIMSGTPCKMEVQGGFFNKVLSRIQTIDCGLKLTDAWGNNFRGLDRMVFATLTVDAKEWLHGPQEGSVLPLHDVIDSVVKVNQRNWCLTITGSYGQKESISFLCALTDARYRDKKDGVTLDPIELQVAFEIEALDLIFHIPQSVSERFKISDADQSIEIDYNNSEVSRKALHGIHLVLVKKGSMRNHPLHPGQKILLRRMRISDRTDVDLNCGDEDDDEKEGRSYDEEVAIDIKDGKSAFLDKYLLTDASCAYHASFDGLEAKLRILVTAGQPSRLIIAPIKPAKVGKATSIEFTARDCFGIAVLDLSGYKFHVKSCTAAGDLSFAIDEPVAKGRDRFCLPLTVTGVLPAHSPSDYTAVLDIFMEHKQFVGPGGGRAQSGSRTSCEETHQVCSGRFEVQVLVGVAQRLRLALRHRGLCEALIDHFEWTSGTKLDLVAQAVDSFGNIDTACRRRVKVSFGVDAGGPMMKAMLENGEATIQLKAWYTCADEAEIMVESVDRGGLIAARYHPKIRPGQWPASVRVLSPQLSGTGDRAAVELDDLTGGFESVVAEVVCADGSVHTSGQLNVVLLLPDKLALAAEFQGGQYRFSAVQIPGAPGDYVLSLKVTGNAQDAPAIPSTDVVVRRTLGNVLWLDTL